MTDNSEAAADTFDRAAMVASAALQDLGRAWLSLPAELREAVVGETAGEVTVGNEAGTFSVRIYEIGEGERPYVHNRWGLADGG